MDWRDTAAATFGSACAVLAGLPFDTLKTYVQTHPGSGLVGSAVALVRSGGVLRLYAGALPALGSQITENATLFTANEALKRSVDHQGDAGTLAALGALAGVCSATAICVPEAWKVRRQAGATSAGGSLWRGLPALLARDIPFNGLYLGAYGLMEERGWGGNAVVRGGAAGAFGWAVMFPVDVVKSRMQLSAGVSFGQAVRMGGLWSGWAAAVLRAMPTNGALFGGYELARRLLGGVGGGASG